MSANADAACDCGLPYIPVSQRAAKNPEKSNRWHAAQLGVDEVFGQVDDGHVVVGSYKPGVWEFVAIKHQPNPRSAGASSASRGPPKMVLHTAVNSMMWLSPMRTRLWPPCEAL
jgi:hypothetical protein